jgi:hypothetical protein
MGRLWHKIFESKAVPFSKEDRKTQLASVEEELREYIEKRNHLEIAGRETESPAQKFRRLIKEVPGPTKSGSASNEETSSKIE